MFIIKKPTKKVVVIVAVLGIVIAGVLLLIFKDNKPKYERVSLVKTQLYVDPDIKDLASFVSELPYETEEFMLEYYPNSGFYFITLRGENDQKVEESKLKADAWIKTHKAFTGNNDFCGLKYQILLPARPNVEVVDIEKQLTMPGCNYANPAYKNPTQ